MLSIWVISYLVGGARQDDDDDGDERGVRVAAGQFELDFSEAE